MLDSRLDRELLRASAHTTAGSCALPSSSLLCLKSSGNALGVARMDPSVDSVAIEVGNGRWEGLPAEGKTARRGERRGRGGGVREEERWDERDAERGGLSIVAVSGSSVRNERPVRSVGRGRSAAGRPTETVSSCARRSSLAASWAAQGQF
jgi:hypothetical protein